MEKLQNVSNRLKNGKNDDYKEVLAVKNDSEFITIEQKNQYNETIFFRRRMDDIETYIVNKY